MSHIHINFEHVNYSYEKSVPILQDITFTAHENDSIGLIGANGVGKSTLLRLLVGLNLDYEGSIRVEEMPVVKEMLPKVREKIGYRSKEVPATKAGRATFCAWRREWWSAWGC